MNAIHTEMLYFQRRLDATQAMADAAAGPCARRAHELLAHLYGETLDALAIRASSAADRVVEPVVSFAARSIRTLPRPRPISRRARLTLRLAC